MENRKGKAFTKLATWLTGIMGLSLLGSSLVFGQTFSATISGVVRDTSGAVLPGVSVTAKHTETGLNRTVLTNETGNYSMPSLPVGGYEVTAELAGFKQQVRRGITLAVAQEVVLNLTLEVGELRQTVEVTGEAPLVNTTLAATSGLITGEQIKDLPINGRSFLDLMTLNAGVISNRSNTTDNNSPSYSIAGKRPDSNRFTMNGVDYVGANAAGVYNAPQGLSGYLLGVDAVREFNVLGHTYGAEYGKRAGAQVTIVTTSGTNQWRGSVFEYLRNNALDTRNFFDTRDAPKPTSVPPFKRNQFGGSLGGPIMRDKMFVYGNYEGFRERLGVSLRQFMPSLQARQGLLPCNLIYPSGPPGSAARAARDANCGTSLEGLNAYLPVPNLQRGMLPFFRYWAEPNGAEALVNGLATGTALYTGNPGRSTQEDFGLARFDYSLSSQDSLSTNFTVDQGQRNNPLDAIFIQNQNTNLYTLSAQETHIFSPTVLNTATFGYSRVWAEQASPPIEPFPDDLVFQIDGTRKNPGTLVVGGGVLSVGAAALHAPNGQNPFYTARRVFTGANDLSVIRGRHNLKMGVWFQKGQHLAFSAGQFNAGSVGYPTLLAFLQDAPSLFRAVPTTTPLDFRTTQAAWYFQDEIKLRPNLTVRLGLRDEMTTGWDEANGRASNYTFDPAGVILTDPNVGKSALTENKAIALWQPRVGLAWDPTGSGKGSVRAGFGIHNDLQDNFTLGFVFNPPFNGRVDIAGRPLLSIRPLRPPSPPSCRAESPLTPPACSIFAPGGIEPTLHTPTLQQWSLTVERELMQDLVLEVGYVGSQSYHVFTSLDMNTIRPVRCEDPAGCLAGGVLPAAQRNVVPQGTEYIPVGTRPNRFVGSTLSWFFFGTGNYHALNLSLLKRSRAGLTFKTNYSWGKTLDINSANVIGQAQNAPPTLRNRWNPKLDKGVAPFSLLHQFNANFSYQLPFGPGKALGSGASGWVEKLIGGWQWNGIFTAQGGFPITPLDGSNRSGNGDSRNPDVVSRNPEFKGNPILGVKGFKKTGRYFDPNAFVRPLAGTFGDVGRGSFRGSGLVNLDTSLFKTIPLNERWNLQFRTEVFNVLNHANFDVPNAVVFVGPDISPSAGAITETAQSGNGRQIQFALRLQF